MTEATLDDYRAFLDRQDVETLRDWALAVARERHDAAFVWGLAKHLPSIGDMTRDWAALDPIDAIRELTHLVRHFREEVADPEVAPLLKAKFIDYLVDHAGHRRFDPKP